MPLKDTLATNARTPTGEAGIGIKNDFATTADAVDQKVRWRNEYVPGTTYEINDAVRDGSYLVIANTQNQNDKPVTEQDAAYPGEAATLVDQTPVNEQTYWTGQEYFVSDAFYVDGFRFYVPAGSFETTVVYRVRNEDGTLQKVKQASPWQAWLIPGWKELSLPSFALSEGQRLEVWIGIRAIADAQTFSSTWDLKHDNSNPLAGEANFYSSGTELRVANEDGSGTNQYAQLQTIQEGGQLSFGGSTWTVTDISNSGGTGGGGRHIFSLAPAQGRPDENEYTLQWSWGATAPLPYVADTTYWQNNQNTRGSVGTSIVDDMTETDAQYGVDMLFRKVVYSDNWDIMAVSGGSGVPGGGSVATAWGSITGTLSNQVDLQTELDKKVDSDPADITGAAAVANIVSISQADYDAIDPQDIDAATLYLITG